MKYLHYIMMLSFVAVLASCSKDLGNYEYKDVNEVTISGLSGSYTLRTGIDTLKITPKMLATMDESDPSRYEHRWIMRLSAKDLDTIGREQNLAYAVRVEPGTRDLYYRVRDIKTGVTWVSSTMRLTVTTAYSRGLLLMGEDEQGFAEAEMLSMISDTVHIKNILSNSGLPRLREPLSLMHTGVDNTNAVKLWAFTKSGSYFLDRATLTGTVNNNFTRSLYVSESLNPETLHPVVLGPQLRTAAGATSSTLYRAVITAGGDLFGGSPLINGGDFFTNPVNRLATNMEERLPAAPYLLYAINNMSAVMWYDTKNNRFLNFTNFVGTSSVVPPETGTIFPWDQAAVGRTLVYAENTRNADGGSTHGNTFAIMKDGANAHHIYKFYVNGTSPAKRNYYAVKPMATDFDKADRYAFSSNRTVVFYSVGNRLHAYDYNPGNERYYSLTVNDGDEISMLKFDTQIDHVVNSLYIATYNAATKGTLRRYRVGTNPDIVELLLQPNSTWTDMIKIKDFNWRAVN